MGSALPIIAGVLCGLVVALPYVVAFIYMRRTHAADVLPGVAALMCSLIISGVSILVVWYVARESLLVFAIALVAVFLVAIAVAAIWFLHRSRS